MLAECCVGQLIPWFSCQSPEIAHIEFQGVPVVGTMSEMLQEMNYNRSVRQRCLRRKNEHTETIKIQVSYTAIQRSGTLEILPSNPSRFCDAQSFHERRFAYVVMVKIDSLIPLEPYLSQITIFVPDGVPKLQSQLLSVLNLSSFCGPLVHHGDTHIKAGPQNPKFSFFTSAFLRPIRCPDIFYGEKPVDTLPASSAQGVVNAWTQREHQGTCFSSCFMPGE